MATYKGHARQDLSTDFDRRHQHWTQDSICSTFKHCSESLIDVLANEPACIWGSPITSIDQIESSSSFASPAELSHRSNGQVSAGCTPDSSRDFEPLRRERISHSNLKVFRDMSVCEVELKHKGTRGVEENARRDQAFYHTKTGL